MDYVSYKVFLINHTACIRKSNGACCGLAVPIRPIYLVREISRSSVRVRPSANWKFCYSGRAGKRRRPRHRDRRLQVHAELQPGEDDARVPGIDDRLPTAPLERQPEGDEGEAVLATGGKSDQRN